jgi:hypothetical protein
MEDNFNVKAPLPNATAVLVLGIISIPTCCCYGIVGLVCAIVALVLARSAKNLYRVNPEEYTEGSYKNLNAGVICAWIGLALAVLYIIYMIVIITTIGFDALRDPQLMRERIQDLFGVM